MKTLIRILQEFWLPALGAILWTVYSLANVSGPLTFIKVVNVFGPAFFLISWATGQFFRVRKQARVERDLTSIEARVDSLLANFESHTEVWLAHAMGKGVAVFSPLLDGRDSISLMLLNDSNYPVFDVHAELIDLDEDVDLANGRLWTRHRLDVAALYPNKGMMHAYRLRLGKPIRSFNVFLQTRSGGATQSIRVASGVLDHPLIAVRTRIGDGEAEYSIPDAFPGYNPDNPEGVFAGH